MLTTSAYDEALRLAHVRLQIADPDLLHGHVEEMTMTTTRGSYKRPMRACGAFAVVYQYQTQAGHKKALRCFRVSMPPDTQERYEVLSHYLGTHAPTITARFRYYSDGIKVCQDRQKSLSQAMIVMDWVEGVTLLDKVHALCLNHDHNGLARLARAWITLLSLMRNAHLAHGDLSARNVIVQEDGCLMLIDYDGCYIPPLAGKTALVSGQPDYQHQDMKRRPFNEWMDDISAYVIYSALRALALQPQLWQKYMPIENGRVVEDRLLFSQNDLQAPSQSALFADLQRINDPLLSMATHLLSGACTQPIESVILPALPIYYQHITEQIESNDFKQREHNGPVLMLKEMIKRGMMREAVGLAQRIERENNAPIPDKAVREDVERAKQAFLSLFCPKTISADQQGMLIHVEWPWPDDEFVRYAVIGWRKDHFPQSACSAETYRYHPVARGPGATCGSFRLSVPPSSQPIYLSVWYTEPVSTEIFGRVTWLYSNPGHVSCSNTHARKTVT